MDTQEIFWHCEEITCEIGKLLEDISYIACTPGKKISLTAETAIIRAYSHLEKARTCLIITKNELEKEESP